MTTGSRPTDSAFTHFRFASRQVGGAGCKAVTTPDKLADFNLDMSIATSEIAAGLAD